MESGPSRSSLTNQHNLNFFNNISKKFCSQINHLLRGEIAQKTDPPTRDDFEDKTYAHLMMEMMIKCGKQWWSHVDNNDDNIRWSEEDNRDKNEQLHERERESRWQKFCHATHTPPTPPTLLYHPDPPYFTPTLLYHLYYARHPTPSMHSWPYILMSSSAS